MPSATETMAGVEDRPARMGHWSVVIAAAIGLIFSQGTLLIYSFGIFLPQLASEFGWSRTQLAGAVTVSQLALAVSVPFWGFLVDRFGPRAILLFSIVALSAMVASLSLLTASIWHFYAVFAGTSLLAAGASPLGYSAVLVRRFNHHLGLTLGLSLMGVGLGATIVPVVAQYLVSAFGWREAYAGIGLVTLVITVPAALVATRNLPPAPHDLGGSLPVSSIMSTRPYVMMCAVFLLFGAVSVGGLIHFVPLLKDHGIAPGEAAKIAGITGLAAIVARGGVGWVMDRVFAPWIVAAFALVGMCAFLTMAFGDGEAAGYLVALLLGAILGAEVDFITFLVRRYFGSAAFGRLYGVAFSLFIVGTGIGPLVLGGSFDQLGSYTPGLLLFAGLCLVAAIVATAMPLYDKPARAAAN